MTSRRMRVPEIKAPRPRIEQPASDGARRRRRWAVAGSAIVASVVLVGLVEYGPVQSRPSAAIVGERSQPANQPSMQRLAELVALDRHAEDCPDLPRGVRAAYMKLLFTATPPEE